MCHHLAAVSVYSTDTKRLIQHHTGIIDEILCGEVVRTFNHEVIAAYDVKGIVFIEIQFMFLYLDIGIQCLDTLSCRIHFRSAHVCRRVNDLSLQICQRHRIAVHQTDSSHSCCCKIQGNRRPQSTCSHYEHT